MVPSLDTSASKKSLYLNCLPAASFILLASPTPWLAALLFYEETSVGVAVYLLIQQNLCVRPMGTSAVVNRGTAPHPRMVQVRKQKVLGGWGMVSAVTLGLWSKERSEQTQKSAFGDGVHKDVRTTENHSGLYQPLAVKRPELEPSSVIYCVISEPQYPYL